MIRMVVMIVSLMIMMYTKGCDGYDTKSWLIIMVYSGYLQDSTMVIILGRLSTPYDTQPTSESGVGLGWSTKPSGAFQSHPKALAKWHWLQICGWTKALKDLQGAKAACVSITSGLRQERCEGQCANPSYPSPVQHCPRPCLCCFGTLDGKEPSVVPHDLHQRGTISQSISLDCCDANTMDRSKTSCT